MSSKLDFLNKESSQNKIAYYISDFQKSTADFKKIKADTIINTYILPVKSTAINNLYVDSCWFNTPTHLINQNENLNVLKYYKLL